MFAQVTIGISYRVARAAFHRVDDSFINAGVSGVVVVVSSTHQSPRCDIWRVEKVWKFWLPTMSVGNPAAKRQLPFGSRVGRPWCWRYSLFFIGNH